MGSSGCSINRVDELVELQEEDRLLEARGVECVDPKDFPEMGEGGTRVPSADPSEWE